VCGIGAVYVVTSLVTMTSPTLSLPASLTLLSCASHSRRTVGAVRTTGMVVREELLYETWGMWWTVLGETVATPFAWMARQVAAGWRALVPSRRKRDKVIREETARVMWELDEARSTATTGGTPLDEPTLRLALPSTPDLTASPNASKP
jgi:hypothetical protein